MSIPEKPKINKKISKIRAWYATCIQMLSKVHNNPAVVKKSEELDNAIKLAVRWRKTNLRIKNNQRKLWRVQKEYTRYRKYFFKLDRQFIRYNKRETIDERKMSINVRERRRADDMLSIIDSYLIAAHQ